MAGSVAGHQWQKGGLVATQAVAKGREKSLRRVPVQGRSVARVARMLDACADLVDEVGYEGLTTTLLAERAGVAIGSVYQFFPDKRAVVQALVSRNLETFLQRLVQRVVPGDFGHWWDGVEAAIDEYVDMHRAVSGLRTLQFGDLVDQHLFDERRDNNTVIAEHLAELLKDRFAVAISDELVRAVAVSVAVIGALTRMAFHQDAQGDPAVLAECKSIVREYLHRHVG